MQIKKDKFITTTNGSVCCLYGNKYNNDHRMWYNVKKSHNQYNQCSYWMFQL